MCTCCKFFALGTILLNVSILLMQQFFCKFVFLRKCTKMPYLKKISLILFFMCFMAQPAYAAEFSAKDLKAMSIFVSNFTELGFYDLNAKEFLNPDYPNDMVRFGVWHNYVNNFKSRIKPCPTKNCTWGSVVLEGRYVQESLKRYFNYTLKRLPTVEQSDPPYHYDGKYYHFEGADGEATYYAKVTKAVTQDNGLIKMTGIVYNTEDESDVLGSFTALAKPHVWKDKKTWALIDLKTKRKE